MDGQKYEKKCARKLRRKGFRNIRMTKASGDQGVDILAKKNGQLYGIQCKYYARGVGNHAVQEAYAGAQYYGCDVAVVLTNSTFTPAAKALAEKTGVLLWPDSYVDSSYNRTPGLIYLLIQLAVLVFSLVWGVLCAKNGSVYLWQAVCMGVAALLALTPWSLALFLSFSADTVFWILFTVNLAISQFSWQQALLLIPPISVLIRLCCISADNRRIRREEKEAEEEEA